MLGFFPTPYPGELLYSALARYQIRSGNFSPKLTIEELFDSRTITATADLPCSLNNLAQNLPKYSFITVDSLIQNNTLYPFYAPFLPLKRAKQIQEAMKTSKGGNIHTMTGIMASAIYTPKYFRFCPDCLQRDLKNYGETYWHRLHQIPGVLFCPTHEIRLKDSQIPIQGSNKHQYHPADESNCYKTGMEIEYSQAIKRNLVMLSQNIAQLTDNIYPSRTLEWFTRRYRTLLINRGYANANGRIKQKRLIDDFVYFYGRDLLNTLGSETVYEDKSNWLTQIVRKHRKAFHPIRHLLMIRFIGESIDSFFQNNKQYKPFGRSPWLCLNVAADHYLQPVITSLKISHCLENKKPLGTFSCSCGMVYSRSGEDKAEEDKLKIGRVITYGRVWSDRLRELVENKLGLRATARELRVDPNTINRYVALLNLTPSWIKNKPQVKPKKVKSIEPEKLKQQKRDIWLDLQQENPELSKTEIRKLAPDVYAWLYRRDRIWLNNNAPKLQKPTASVDRIDWNVRDKEILIQVKSAVKQLLEKDKPIRITISRVGSSLGLKALLEKHLDKLPLIKAYFESETETVEDFQIRRIKWAVKELDEQGEEIRLWKILRLAGLRENCSEKVREAIAKALQEPI